MIYGVEPKVNCKIMSNSFKEKRELVPSEADHEDFNPAIEVTEALSESPRYFFEHREISAKTNQEAVNAFIEDVTTNYRLSFEKLITDYSAMGIKFSGAIKEYLKNKDLLNPRFDVYTGEDIERVIRDLDLEDSYQEIKGGPAKKNEILLIFNLPKPLAVYWWKESEDIKKLSGKIVSKEAERLIPRGIVISWGDFYRSLMLVVWEAIGYFESESHFYFERINPSGQHDTKKYYYVWLVGGEGKNI
jgi:hypothetical protein